MFRLPTNVVMEPGCLSGLSDYLSSLGTEHLFLVTDSGVRSADWFNPLVSGITGKLTLVDSIQPNPRVITIDGLAGEARALDCKAVLGLGGGSVLDAAKAIAMLLTNGGSIRDYVGENKFSNQSAPFIAVPTTCGTGSEVTWVSVVSDPEEGTKISIKGDSMFPRAAFVDADVLASLPTHLIASTGMDAMTHALEAIVSRGATPASDALAVRAVQLLIRHLGPCVRDPGHREHRKAVINASTLAGMAFGNADVGAVHCLSEAIGGLLDKPHGLLNTLLLVPVLRYQFTQIRARLRPVTAALGAHRPESLMNRLETMVGVFPLPSWSELGIDPVHFEKIASLAEANGSNPSNLKNMRQSDYLRILTSL